ncbi:MAG: twin-arginine translocase subunit TatC [Candidatus Hydrogenedentes bacterium]|nr:twin-arginine translocase subunit TatC [Candidatus Hydrogenedentota bacterium]
MSNNDARMTFTEHLGELRTRLIRSAIAVAVGFVIAYALKYQLYALIMHPLEQFSQTNVQTVQAPGAPDSVPPALPAETETNPDAPAAKFPPKARQVTMNPFESFIVMLRISLYGGIVLAFPVILYQVCAFVFPGLTPTEKRSVQVLLFGGLFLAMAGVSLAYFAVFPNVMPYLLTFAPPGVETQLRLSETVSQILVAMLGFAIAFQFPILLLVLVYLGLLPPETLTRHWRFWMIGIALVSAVFTPPDPFSILFMTIPLWGLYWISVLFAFLIVRKKKSKDLVPL